MLKLEKLALQYSGKPKKGERVFKTLVVPLDGSKLAEAALPYAEELGAKMDSEVVLLSVLESEETNEYEKHHKYAERIVEITKRHVEKYLDKSDKPIQVWSATRTGSPAEGILEYVGGRKSQLIIMATHGRSGVTRWAMGSVADKMVRSSAKQPLMLIRAKGTRPDVREKRILKKALVPLDGSDRSEAIIHYISEMASSLEMEVTCLQVVPKRNRYYADAEAYLQSVCSRLKDRGITAQYKVGIGTAAEEIIDVADEFAMDVVAMSTHGRTTLSLWPLGSVAQKVLLGGNTPLMLVRS